MNKKLAAALSGGAVLVLTLSGCSSDDNSDKVNDWAKTVCDKVQPQLQKIANANAAIQQQTADNSKPADVQRTDSAAFQQISQAYKALGAAVDSAGAPPVDGGETTQKEAVKELNASSAAYANLEKKVDALDTKDQAKFADGLKGIADELNKISNGGDKALTKLQSGEVATAMAKQKGCQKPTASVAPNTASPKPGSPSPSASPSKKS
ncbi:MULTISPECIES: small secreted protein [unclassified Streptomyces]|uniref:small secreted protein n=1 Tax=unclassified Streptomyces TaxID=2593676 RepID=UPI0022509FB2|nr:MULTISPECIES: small secreted protein [unclassified Streptomyces]WSP55904.1 small secreted protein [Streptomyces sp. NBC_01241]WSU23360.1 small secreted protein [Streptomyces sp. NBC_01108]MCX4787620.1 small secreted protein [Streptomyces sp. NBC_01221]MCX4796595.1 small secreted protein [Streptomyces sp. NBC_01242]WSJ37830.1 small secreted protein [Streptomyces sp. NBC_01321]